MKNENGFTLLEMLLVMFIISVLLLLIVPNIVNQRKMVEGKGCDALLRAVSAQVQAYKLEHDKIPTMEELETAGYITSKTCPNGRIIQISANDGSVNVQ